MHCRSMLLVFAAALGLHAQTVNAVAVGHQFRQDDSPALAVCPDGSAWGAWLSFAGDRVAFGNRQYKDNRWGSLQWVPGTSGDNWPPQVGCDPQNRAHVVWSQQAGANWDLDTRALATPEQPRGRG